MKTHDHPPTIDETFDWNNAYSGDASDYEPPNELMLALGEELPAGRALDVGCGAGGLLVALSQLGWQVTGIDVAKKAIAAAREVLAKHGVEASLEVADAGQWRPTGEFDLLTNSFALPFGVAARAPVFAMFRRALAPGGTVVLQDFDASMAHSGFLAGTDLITLEELHTAFAGFNIVRAEVCETPAHQHNSEHAETAPEPWSAAIFCARKPG